MYLFAVFCIIFDATCSRVKLTEILMGLNVTWSSVGFACVMKEQENVKKS